MHHTLPAQTSLRVSVTSRCNLRCDYCWSELKNLDRCKIGFNPPAKLERDLPLDQLLALVRICIKVLNVKKIRLTGGEPLMRKDIGTIAKTIIQKEGVENLGVTTNGQILKEWVNTFAGAGLKSINVSLDSLNKHTYSKITGGGHLQNVLEGLIEAKRAGISSVKINCVVMKGINDNEIEQMVQFGISEGIEIRFVELIAFHGTINRWKERFYSGHRILKKIKNSFKVEKISKAGEQTARLYSVEGNSGRGTVGIIGSMDGKMCMKCNRVRITSDGKLRRCLKDPNELNLLDMVVREASDEKITDEITRYIKGKKIPASKIAQGSMIRIGG